MKELVTYLLRSLAGRPEEVMVTETAQEKGTALELIVADEDLNHLIGKQGRTVKAMRTLLAAAAAKKGGRFSLKIAAAGSPAEAVKAPEPAPTGNDDADQAQAAVEPEADHG